MATGAGRGIRWVLLSLGVGLYLLHFAHLTADFPAGADWNDWSRFTDEGWYSDAATRHFVLHHWFLPGDFNPAVAMPVWPLLLMPAFAVFGVSPAVARGLVVALFGLALWGVWLLLEECSDPPVEGLAGPAAVLLLAASPFVYAFEREAVLEPVLAGLTVWALVVAGRLRGPGWKSLGPAVALGLLLVAMVLTKPTAVALLPAVIWRVWARAGYRIRAFVRMAAVPVGLAVVVWGGYFALWVRPRYLEDYRYLFTANAYTSFQVDPLWQVVSATVGDMLWAGGALCGALVAVLSWWLVGRPAALRRPLVPALLLWMGGYLGFLGYHNNLQARYYLLLAFPATMLVGLGLQALWSGAGLWRPWVATGCVLGIAVPDAVREIGFALHPTYSYVEAARQVAATVRADQRATGHSPWVLSVSGADLSLMTGLPAINTEFSTMDLDQLIARYQPGWYVTWNEVDDEDMQAIAPRYQLVPVASFPAMDDPDRNVLLLYRMEPKW